MECTVVTGAGVDGSVRVGGARNHGQKRGLLGFAFGIGWFGVGISWVYVSMHVYGLMPAPLAAAATAAFCAYLALYPALALGLARFSAISKEKPATTRCLRICGATRLYRRRLASCGFTTCSRRLQAAAGRALAFVYPRHP